MADLDDFRLYNLSLSESFNLIRVSVFRSLELSCASDSPICPMTRQDIVAGAVLCPA